MQGPKACMRAKPLSFLYLSFDTYFLTPVHQRALLLTLKAKDTRLNTNLPPRNCFKRLNLSGKYQSSKESLQNTQLRCNDPELENNIVRNWPPSHPSHHLPNRTMRGYNLPMSNS